MGLGLSKTPNPWFMDVWGCQSPPNEAQLVKDLPAVQETQVQSLDQKDPLEKGIATHSSILAWRIPWREEPGRLCSMGS